MASDTMPTKGGSESDAEYEKRLQKWYDDQERKGKTGLGRALAELKRLRKAADRARDKASRGRRNWDTLKDTAAFTLCPRCDNNPCTCTAHDIRLHQNWKQVPVVEKDRKTPVMKNGKQMMMTVPSTFGRSYFVKGEKQPWKMK